MQYKVKCAKGASDLERNWTVVSFEPVNSMPNLIKEIFSFGYVCPHCYLCLFISVISRQFVFIIMHDRLICIEEATVIFLNSVHLNCYTPCECVWEREGDRETDRQTDRQSQRDRERERERDRQTDRQRVLDNKVQKMMQLWCLVRPVCMNTYG